VGDHDIDVLGHASNISVIQWIQNAAVAHSEAVGLDLAGYQRLGGWFVVRRHEVDYLRSVLRGQTLEVRTWIDSPRAASTIRATEFARVADGVLVAQARTSWAFVDVATGRATRIHEAVKVAFGAAWAKKVEP
jgi:acyl-CoA thioester hydrolase